MTSQGRGRGPEITLSDGPHHGQRFWEEDFLERIRAAQRMGRTFDDGRGRALGYERPPSGVVWQWRGRNCHPNPID